MAFVRQLKTAKCCSRLISKYEFIIPWN